MGGERPDNEDRNYETLYPQAAIKKSTAHVAVGKVAFYVEQLGSVQFLGPLQAPGDQGSTPTKASVKL